MTPDRQEGTPRDPLGRALCSSEFLETTSVGLMLHGADGGVLGGNRAATELLGDSIEMIVGRTTTNRHWGAVREDGSPFPADERPAMVTLRSGELCCDVIVGIDNPGTARRWLSVSSCPVRLDDGARGAITSFIDVSEEIQNSQLLKLLTEVNRVAVLAADEPEFLQQLCNVLVDRGHYALAWIGELSSDEKGVDIVCAAGATDYLDAEMAPYLGSEWSHLGPTSTALRTGSRQVINDMASNASNEMWRDRAIQFGLGAMLSLPFRLGGKQVVLDVYDWHIIAFNEAVIVGLEAITEEIEFGADHLLSVHETRETLAALIVSTDAQKETDRAREQAEQRFRIAFEDNVAGMVFTDLDDKIMAVNTAFCKMVGRTEEELIGRDSTPFTLPEDIGITTDIRQRFAQGESGPLSYIKRYVHRDGRLMTVEVHKSAARDEAGTKLYFVTSERDVTEERSLTAQLSHRALHDPLTGLANRVLFMDHLSKTHAKVVLEGGLAAVLMLDLDDFKGVNDTFGHQVGDQLLVAVSRRLERVTRDSDVLCRFGGDEFVYLANGLSSTADAERLAERLLNEFAESFSIAGVQFDQRASVGVTFFDGMAVDYTELIQDADVAMYEAKRRDRGHHVVFSPAMREEATSRYALFQELRQALGSGEVSMYYQPIVNLATTAIVGFEALMRWQHPERGWVPPDLFIPLAEQSDLILELGAFALREAVTAASLWRPVGAGATMPYVTVNLSARQFHDPGLIAMTEDVLATSGLAPDRLIFEITESLAMLDVAETLEVIEQFVRLGIGVALDDFGTGYSSLSYIVLLNPRILKIDRYFVNSSTHHAQNNTVLESIVTLGNKLHMTMVAEGIETLDQLKQLRHFNCELGQGYLFSRAIPPGEVAALLGRDPGSWGWAVGD